MPWASMARVCAPLGVEGAAEMEIVFWLMLQAHLANAVFALGRNIGPVLFMQHVGAGGLTSVMFVSGLLVMFTSPLYAKLSDGKRAAVVNHALVLTFVVLILGLTAPLLVPLPPQLAEYILAPTGYVIFLAEDMLTMMLMMQSSSLAQASLTSQSAKRLLGLIQLGSSTGAMTAGLSAGPLAKVLGAERMVFVQVGLLLLSLGPNASLWNSELDDPSVKRKKKPPAGSGGTAEGRAAEASAEAPGAEWWRSPLILSMGVWTFGIIFCKTVVEYQYNVLVAASVSEGQMVALTGQLYAAAGLLSSLLNLFGTAPLLRHCGMLPTVLICPVFLLLGAFYMLLSPSVFSSFCGRSVDLTLRWSLNNTVKSLLWIATPRDHQIHAKPWVEGTVKKVTASVAAIAIGVWLWATKGTAWHSAPSLSWMSVVVAAICCLACVQMHRLYAQAMWDQIQRRELQLCDKDFALDGAWWTSEDAHGESVPELDWYSGGGVLRRLRDGPPHVQLYILRQMGEALPSSAWSQFMEGFSSLSPAVQARPDRPAPAQHSRAAVASGTS